MISKKDILKMVRTVTRRSQGKPTHRLMNPKRDWLVGIGLFLIIALAGSIINAQSYVYFNNIESRVSETTVPVKEYRTEDAATAIERYEERAVRFETLANEVVPQARGDRSTSTATSTATSSETATSSAARTDEGTDTETEATEEETNTATSTTETESVGADQATSTE